MIEMPSHGLMNTRSFVSKCTSRVARLNEEATKVVLFCNVIVAGSTPIQQRNMFLASLYERKGGETKRQLADCGVRAF